jgi:hypothetical protein
MCLIPAKNQSWTQYQDQASNKGLKRTQYHDDHIGIKNSKNTQYLDKAGKFKSQYE